MNTSIVRLRTSLQEVVLEELNNQMVMEAHSSASYLSMSAWCSTQGLAGCAKFFRKQSGEEREHLLRIFDYINDVGGHAVSPEVKNIEIHFEGLRYLFIRALEMEIAITENFNRITEICHAQKDFQTARFLQWYLDEQREEEQQARRCVEIYDLLSPDNGNIYLIDKEIAKHFGHE